MNNDPSTQDLAQEMFLAIHRGAPTGWISDYLEYIGEYEGEPELPTFVEYLLFQIEVEEEAPMEERQSAGEYLSMLLRYVHQHHPDRHPHLYCTYCQTSGHAATDCPDMPMEGYTIRVHVPANMNGATSLTSYLSQFVQDGGVIVAISEDD